jgi:hypothetical protein
MEEGRGPKHSLPFSKLFWNSFTYGSKDFGLHFMKSTLSSYGREFE